MAAYRAHCAEATPIEQSGEKMRRLASLRVAASYLGDVLLLLSESGLEPGVWGTE